jgi:hypothetical protein
MKKYFLIVLFFLNCAILKAHIFKSPTQDFHEITKQELVNDVKFLASDELEGRLTGSIGAEKARAFIEERFKKLDINFLEQDFEFIKEIKLDNNNFFETENKQAKLEIDYLPFSFSESKETTCELAFVGYGISAEKLGYDDYKGIDVKNKCVLIFTHEPKEKDEKGPFRTSEYYYYTEVRYKVTNAREHGAQGVIILKDPINHESDRDKLFANITRPASNTNIPVVNITYELAQLIFDKTNKNLIDIQNKIDTNFSPQSFIMQKINIHFNVRLKEIKGNDKNVIGVLEGYDHNLKNEFVVIGAHYDHLGRGEEASLDPDKKGEIHNGADDNASGVTGVLALAKIFKTIPHKRTIVFSLFSGEEIGLIGSNAFIKNSTFPIEKINIMLNMDMIGRQMENKLNIHGTGTGEALEDIITEARQNLGLNLSFSLDGYGPSDHMIFYANKIPALFFFTGSHKDYHRPSDDWDKINYIGMLTVLKLVQNVVEIVSDDPNKIVYKETKPPKHDTGRGFNVRLGSIPDYSYTGEGVKLLGVRDKSPAEKAGLQAGDIIIEFGGVKILNINDLTFVLQTKRPGDRVKIFFIRNNETKETEAILEALI